VLFGTTRRRRRKATDAPRQGAVTPVPAGEAPPSEAAPRRRRRGPWIAGGVLFLLLCVLGGWAVHEARTSTLQARFLSRIAGDLEFHLEPGPSPHIRFPVAGPYNERFGYTRIPDFVDRLRARGFSVEAQARVSPAFENVVDRGLYPVYRGKTQGGLEVLDRRGASLFQARYPERVFPAFDTIPEVLIRSLLFIENRELLDPRMPTRNPVLEWGRLAGASFDYTMKLLGSDRSVPGASTLPTQIEKFRNSPGGITGNAGEKARQLASASLRIYLDGPETIEAQRQVVLDYLNSVPLAAIPGHGEVNGLAKGLWVWYGLDHREVGELLRLEGGPLRPGDVPAPSEGGRGELVASPAGTSSSPEPVRAGLLASAPPELQAETGRAYRATLSLLLAHRRPTWYLGRPGGREELKELTDSYLRLLGSRGMISPELQRVALAAELDLRPRAPDPAPVSFVERKAANAVRTGMLGLLGVSGLYDLDRMDITVRSSIDGEVQRGVSDIIARLTDPAFVREQGLLQGRLLARGDPALVTYSFVLYERTPLGNVVRVQTDNYEGPLDLNFAGRMELGSTAKLRTLVTYLEIIDERYRRFAGLNPAEAAAVLPDVVDPLTRWTVDFLRANPGATVEEVLEGAMQRRYSASPRERFVTGGGVHTFSNFDRVHDNQVISVHEAFRHSVNLPFIRMMRDIERYYLYRTPGTKAQILEDPSDPRRQEYLARFADEEGQVFMNRFYRELSSAPPDSVVDRVVGGHRLTLQRMAWAFRTILPDAPVEEFQAFLRRHPARESITEAAARRAFDRAGPGTVTLADAGYLAGIHPLELWTANYLVENPGASRADLIRESVQARQDVYRWLFNTRRRDAQDRRIRSLLEVEAFMNLQEDWRRLGYPFENVVPSLASAIGSSGDRPGALAELVGVLVNDGVRYPVLRVEEVHLAAGTPFETVMNRSPFEGVRVLSPEVARVARAALSDVVENGTGRRVRGAVTDPEGNPVRMGGKTGTGDNRFNVYTPGGALVSSRAVSRTSTFVFYIGDRFYGVMTAFVQGPEADRFDFTSALPAQVVRILGPELSRLEGIASVGPTAGLPRLPPPATGVPSGEEGVVTGGTGTGDVPPAPPPQEP